MKNLNLNKVSKILTEKLGRNIELVDHESVGCGYHSDGYRLVAKNGEEFFIKKFKSNDLGFELPERKIASLLVSNGMSKRSDTNPKGIGILVKNGEEKQLLPEINDNTDNQLFE